MRSIGRECRHLFFFFFCPLIRSNMKEKRVKKEEKPFHFDGSLMENRFFLEGG